MNESRDTIRCISLWQPWASLVLWTDPKTGRAEKGYETRSWMTPHRGRLLIHAAKQWKPEQRNLWLNEEPFRTIRLRHFRDRLSFGAIIGEVTLLDVVTTRSLATIVTDQELDLGDFSSGRYAWQLANPILYKMPIPYRGYQGMFTVPASVIRQFRLMPSGLDGCSEGR